MTGKQEDLRRLIREKMTPSVSGNQSPFAKVSASGKITCTVCPGVTIKNWATHQISAQHKRNMTANKGAEAPPFPTFLRKPEPSKKLPETSNIVPKSILKNRLKFPVAPVNEKQSETTERAVTLKRPASPSKEEPDSKTPKGSQDNSTIPEGFFDDPKLDAKARNIEYKDPQEVEWEIFQKELREEGSKSEQVVEIDEEKEMRERELYEADEMISNWEKIRVLEIRKDQLKKTDRNDDNTVMDDDDEVEFQEFVNWRQKAVE